jgi:hypothetical protein
MDNRCLDDDLKMALDVVDICYDAEDILRKPNDPHRRHKDVPDIPGCKPLGALIPLCEKEREQLDTVIELIAGYLGQRRHVRPL